jgi:hypothetical protein
MNCFTRFSEGVVPQSSQKAWTFLVGAFAQLVDGISGLSGQAFQQARLC